MMHVFGHPVTIMSQQVMFGTVGQPQYLTFKKSENLGRGWAQVQSWDGLVGAHTLIFNLVMPTNNPITEYVPDLYGMPTLSYEVVIP